MPARMARPAWLGSDMLAAGCSAVQPATSAFEYTMQNRGVPGHRPARTPLLHLTGSVPTEDEVKRCRCGVFRGRRHILRNGLLPRNLRADGEGPGASPGIGHPGRQVIFKQ